MQRRRRDSLITKADIVKNNSESPYKMKPQRVGLGDKSHMGQDT